jgi:hypothetical protein
MDVVRFGIEASGQQELAGGGVVFRLFLNVKHATGSRARRCAACSFIAITIAALRSHRRAGSTTLRKGMDSTGLTVWVAVSTCCVTEEAQHQALSPVFLNAKRAQFHRAPQVDGERRIYLSITPPPAVF